MRAGDSNAMKKKIGIYNLSQNHSTAPTEVLIVINILGLSIFTDTPYPQLTPQEHLTSSDCIHVPATLSSVLSVSVCFLTHSRGMVGLRMWHH